MKHKDTQDRITLQTILQTIRENKYTRKHTLLLKASKKKRMTKVAVLREKALDNLQERELAKFM